jgi:hypothetical protein
MKTQATKSVAGRLSFRVHCALLLGAWRRTGCLALAALASAGAPGCGADAREPEGEAELGQVQQALADDGGSLSLGWGCTPEGNCTCDKGVELDCELMRWSCSPDDLEKFDECVRGWGTTHCDCREATDLVSTTPVWSVADAIDLQLLFAR